MMLFARVVVIALALVTAACGQKGPPLAPLHLVPSAPAGVAVKRVADEARLRFEVPSSNVNGPGPLALDRVEVYAATIAPGAGRPSNKELFMPRYRVGTNRRQASAGGRRSRTRDRGTGHPAGSGRTRRVRGTVDRRRARSGIYENAGDTTG